MFFPKKLSKNLPQWASFFLRIFHKTYQFWQIFDKFVAENMPIFREFLVKKTPQFCENFAQFFFGKWGVRSSMV